MQNVVFLMDSSVETYSTPLKVGNMYLNRFFIDEQAAFELSGVYYLKEPQFRFDESDDMWFYYQLKYDNYLFAEWILNGEIKRKGASPCDSHVGDLRFISATLCRKRMIPLDRKI